MQYQLQKAQDYNDIITKTGGSFEMKLYYMCAKNDPNSWTGEKCGIFQAVKTWNRKGAEPTTCKRWYCGLEPCEWANVITTVVLPEAGNNHCDFNMELALNVESIGCKCRFQPFAQGASMVLEVIDRSVKGTCTMYAIRAAIPPGPLSDEIQKVQRGWISAGQRTNPKDLYENIPVMFPKTHVMPGVIAPALGRLCLLYTSDAADE